MYNVHICTMYIYVHIHNCICKDKQKKGLAHGLLFKVTLKGGGRGVKSSLYFHLYPPPPSWGALCQHYTVKNDLFQQHCIIYSVYTLYIIHAQKLGYSENQKYSSNLDIFFTPNISSAQRQYEKCESKHLDEIAEEEGSSQ